MKLLLGVSFAESELAMSYDIFKHYGLDKIKDSLTENIDYKQPDGQTWKQVATKQVMDSDGFMTDYTWYTNGDLHIFMFGDTDLVEPDEDYADWTCETEQEAQEWYDSYTGFESEEDHWDALNDDVLDENYTGNSNFMNDAFDRIYNIVEDAEE